MLFAADMGSKDVRGWMNAVHHKTVKSQDMEF